MVSGRQVESGRARSATAWSAAARAPSSAAVHRLAARMDGEFELVAGALSSNPERAKASAAELGLDPSRSYGSFAEMAKAEAKRPDGIEAVAIVTPNNVHYPAAKAFLEAGIHVICDKPLTSNLADAQEAGGAGREERQGVRAHPQLHRLSDGPAGARHGGEGRARRHPRRAGRISAGLADRRRGRRRLEAGGCGAPTRSSRASAALPATSARMPTISRASSPAWNSPSLSADLDAFVPGRKVDDNLNVLLRFKPVGKAPAAKGMIWASQVAPGHENGLKLQRLRHQGRHRMGAGRPELSLVHAVRPAEATDHRGRAPASSVRWRRG